MKTLLLVFLSFGILQAQKKSHLGTQAVEQTIKNLFEALSNRDSIVLKNTCTEDVTLFEYGQVWNLDTLIRKAIRQNTAIDFTRKNTFNFINTTIKGNTAWAYYYLRSDFTRDNKESFAQWLETIVLIKAKKKWKVKVLHSSLLKRG